MKIKQKLHLGFGLLFVVVIFFGGLSLFYLKQIGNSSRIILKDNFATLSYTREMRSLLNGNDLPLPAPVIAKFNAALLKEQNNITEAGELLEVEKLTKSFQLLKKSALPVEQQLLLKKETLQSLERIEGLNLDAVVRKSDRAERNTQNATMYLGIGAAVAFLVLFSFVFNFAGFFEEPLRRLTEAIRDVNRKKFNTRLSFDLRDEFGEITLAYNQMVEDLNQWNNEMNTALQAGRMRTEIVLNQLPQAVIALNENDEIVLMNLPAEKLFRLDKYKVSGQKAENISVQDRTLKETLAAGNGSRLRIGEVSFKLEVHEIVVPKAYIPDGDDEPVGTAANSAGNVYILKKE